MTDTTGDAGMKQLKTLSFVEGTLSIKSRGYGPQNGWGELVFDESQIEFRVT